ncbi:MAG: hypothetical protein HY901_35110 [Deltaproteobacteria bacterium]|nr:hypothetical protein [Deltaproteobacteria bacterium]
MSAARTLSSFVIALFLFAYAEAMADVPPGTAHVDSATLPIRVYYDATFPMVDAQEVVKMAETSWSVQVGQMGFAAPWRLVDGKVETGLALWMGNFTSAGYEATADIPATPQTDCAMLGGVPGPLYTRDREYFALSVERAFSFVSLLGVDCIEPPRATSMFTGAIMHCEGRPGLYAGIDVFQKHPEYAIDFQSPPEYRRGASIFPLFYEERFGARDGKLLAELWKLSGQNGTITSVGDYPAANVANIPTYLDAFDTLAKAKGSSFDEAFEEFAIWRTLTGPTWADGKHFQDASIYPEIAWTAQHTLAELPVSQRPPVTKVAAYGSSHVLFETAGAAAGKALAVRVTGTAPYRWAADALCMRAGAGAKVVSLAMDPETRSGSAMVPDSRECNAVALVVANLSNGNYDANHPSTTNDGDYRYSASLVDMPTIATIDPTSLPQGLRGQSVRVKGAHFTDGAKLAARFSGTGVAVESTTLLDELTAVLVVSVEDAAPLGARDLLLTTGEDLEASLPAALLVNERPAPPDAGREPTDASLTAPDAGTTPGSPGGCSHAGAGMQISLVAGLAVFFTTLRRRSR